MKRAPAFAAGALFVVSRYQNFCPSLIPTVKGWIVTT